MITGLRPKTFENLQTNAGAFLKNFDWRKYKTLDEMETAVIEALDNIKHLIGATIGGGSFQCTPSIRNREADGMRYPIVGSTVNDMWTVKLTGTMKEITPQNFKDALICADMETSADFTFTDKGEGSLPFEFQAHAKDLASMEYAPVEIVFFDEPEEATAAQDEGEEPGEEPKE